MPEQLPPEVLEMSPGRKLVYTTLEGSVHDQDSLADATGLTKRFVREVLNELVEEGLVVYHRQPSDQRRKIYYDPEAFDLISAQQTYASKQAED